MAITLVAQYWNSVNNLNHTAPLTGYVAGDVAVLHYGFNSGDGSAAMTAGVGWAQLAQNINSSGDNSRSTGVFYKVLGAGEVDPTVTASGTFTWGSAWVDVAMHIFRGVDNTTPLDATLTSNIMLNDTTPDCADITTATANAAISTFCFNPNYGGTFGVPATPSGFVDGTSDGGYSFHGWLLDAGSAGAKVIGDWQLGGYNAGVLWDTYTVALRAVAVATTGTPLYLGSAEHDKAYLGTTPIAAIYLGSTKTFEA